MSHTTTTTDTARDLIAHLKYRYHHYEHASEAVETEIREILAGNRRGLLRLKNLVAKRDDSFDAFRLYLGTITSRLKQGDTRLGELLSQKFKSLNEGRFRPLHTEDDE